MNNNALNSIIRIACAIAVAALAVAVRVPSAFLSSVPADQIAAYTTAEGLPYLTDPDSYYHVRLVQNHLETGSLGDSVSENGTPWDSLRFYPEGRSARYQPGIVWLTEAVYAPLNTLFGTSLYAVEYALAACMSALAALAAFALGRRMAGDIGGLAAGALVACAPAFVARTTLGRFDTDMFVVLFDVLLLLAITQAMRAGSWRTRLAWAAGFGLASLGYMNCWSPRHSSLVALLLLAGGSLCVVALAIAFFARKDPPAQVAELVAQPLQSLGMCAIAFALAAFATGGFDLFASAASAAAGSASITAEGEFPNLLASISELNAAAWVPDSPALWFGGPISAARTTVLNSAGGVVVAALAAAATIWLLSQCSRRLRERAAIPLERRECLLYACMLLPFLIAGLYLSARGMRFVEHLAVPAGVLAGACAGWIATALQREKWNGRWTATALTAVVVMAAIAPSALCSMQTSATSRPSVSDASEQAMTWVRENARDEQAVVAAWWDLGYFYESESGHPCLWDGGLGNSGDTAHLSTEAARAILFSKAMITEDPELSRCILMMLAHSGNSAIDILVEQLGAREAFDTLWEVLPLGSRDAEGYLQSRCYMSAEEARNIDTLIHPASDPETYLVVSTGTMRVLPWLKYYANWNFESKGENAQSPAEVFAQNLVQPSEHGQSPLVERLYNGTQPPSQFEPVFEQDDGCDRVLLYRIR